MDNDGYFLILCKNSASGGFLKFCCNEKSETMLIKFSYSVPLKSIDLSCSVTGPLPVSDFVTKSSGDVGHPKNTGSLCYVDLINVDTFPYKMLKSHLLILPLISSEKFLSIEKLLSSECNYKSSKIPIFVGKLEFVSAIFLKATSQI